MAESINEKYLVSYDQTQLFCQEWHSRDTPVATVALVHGLGEHSGRYTHIGSYLAERKISLQGFDLRGHGKSGGKRGDTPSFEAYLDDIDVFLSDVCSRSKTPLFLYGHSLGGILVVAHILNRRPAISGAICTGLALQSSLEKQVTKLALVKIVGRFFPHLILSSGLDPKMLSRDPEVVNSYVNDPLVHNQASLHFAAEVLEAIPVILKMATEFSVPLLLMHGECDQLAYPSSSIELNELVANRCTLRIFAEMYHEIHNEFGNEQVFSYLYKWLINQIEESDPLSAI